MKNKMTTLSETKNVLSDDPRQFSPSDAKLALFLRQKELLDTFLSRHAISQAQYDKSLGDLIVKMGISPEEDGISPGKES